MKSTIYIISIIITYLFIYESNLRRFDEVSTIVIYFLTNYLKLNTFIRCELITIHSLSIQKVQTSRERLSNYNILTNATFNYNAN